MLAGQVIVGGVVSMFAVTVPVPVLPATSWKLALAVWPAPCWESITLCLLELATPERLSLAVKVMVTALLFQPFAFGLGDWLLVTVGGVRSMLTAGEVNLAMLPVTSVTVTMPVTDLPCVERTSGLLAGLVKATPEVASLAANGMETGVLFQPAAFGAGVGVPKVRVGL